MISPCCGTVSGCTGTQASTYDSSSTYCIENDLANGILSVSTADSSCTGLCSIPENAVCTPVTYGDSNAAGEASWCANYDNSDAEYCCAVGTLNEDGSYDASSGLCMTVDTVELN